MEQDIRIVRLTTGEELISKVTDADAGYLLEDVYILIPVGQGKIAFGQWMPYADLKDGIKIKEDNVMFIIKVVEEMKRQYIEAVSGIVSPNSKLTSAADIAAGMGPVGEGVPDLRLTT